VLPLRAGESRRLVFLLRVREQARKRGARVGAADLYSPAPRREDPDVGLGPVRRAQAGDGPVRRPQRLRGKPSIWQSGGERGHEAYAHYLLGKIAARDTLPALEEASRHYETALGLSERLGMRPLSDRILARQASAAAEVPELGHLFIVAPSNTDLYEFLTQDLAGASKMFVTLDRRQGRPRPGGDGETGEKRLDAERRQAQIEEDLRNWGLAVTPRRQG
jgi:hypothetical protein